jgi:peptidyl-prolyl cis-trans isomerase C
MNAVRELEPLQRTLEGLQAAAVRAGLLSAAEPAPADGVPTEAAAAAIEALLEQGLETPEPDEAACRRHHAAQAARFGRGERARLRHVLFGVTPGVDIGALRRRAEACLLDLRSAGASIDAAFAEAARTLSNCPSGTDGGALGWLTAEDCAPEFAREIFHGPREIGVLARLVHSRFGLHVVEVLERQAAELPPFEAVQAAVAQSLRQAARLTALRNRIQALATGQPLLQ